MGFKINYNDTWDNGNVEPGYYEIIVKDAKEEKNEKTGTIYINMPLVIRNDIADQKFKNAFIWHKMYRKKDTHEYIGSQINSIAKALQLPDGKEYASLDELLFDFIGHSALVKVTNEDYKGRDYLKVQSWMPTKYPQCNHQWKDASEGGGSAQGSWGTEVPMSADCPF